MMDTLIKKCSWKNVDAGLLVLRIGVGLVFIFSGITKLIDISMTVDMFAQIGIPAFLAYIVAIAEFAGGTLFLLGIATRVWAFILGVIMVVAIIIMIKNPAMIMTPVLLLFSLVAVLLSGGGRYALTKSC